MHMRKEKKDKKKPSKSGKRNKGQCGIVSNERLVIPVHKYDAEVFRMLIQFVHTGTAYVTTENVTGELDTDTNANSRLKIVQIRRAKKRMEKCAIVQL